MAPTPDVLIVGGGIIGLTAAYTLSKAGATVAVFDRGDLGREASWAGAGIIPPGNPDRAATPIDQLRAITAARLPDFAGELRDRTGIDNGYRRCGGVEFLTPEDEYAVPLWAAEGVAFERLTSTRLQGLEPGLNPVPGTPYYLPAMAQVRNPWHMRALAAACERAGVRLHPHTTVECWVTDGDRVRAVRLASGEERPAGRFLLAAGAWGEPFLAALGSRPGVHPVRGQIVLLRSAAGPRHVLVLGKRYLVPRGDGRVLVGSTEEPEAGFEKRTTAAGVADLIAFARDTVPALADAEVETCWAGLRPGSPDGLPFVGRVPGAENVVAAVGHFRAGVQLSIGTAELVADLLLGRPPVVPADSFRLDREPYPRARPTFRS
jgi:glycine oxidase